MKKHFLLFALLLTACQQNSTTNPTGTATRSPASGLSPSPAPQPAGFQLALSDTEVLNFEPKFQKADLRPDTKLSALVLGNYDFELKPMSANSVAEIKAPEQIRVHIAIKGGPQASYKQPLPPGEYRASETYIDIYRFKDGAQQISQIENRQGKVIITSSSESEIVGSLDVQGDKNVVLRGEFKAKVVK